MSELPQSRVPDPMDAPPVRWGILGTGLIAGAMAYAVRSGTRSTLAVVGSRNAESAARFATEHGVARSVGSYAELVAAQDVDIVYVASPHSAHLEHALLALEAGKPVLVEKAFTRNADEASRLLGAARAAGLFCMEAMWARFLPHYDVVRQLVEGGHLGTVHTVFADHGQRLWPGGPQRLSDPALAGGALLDLATAGCAALNWLYGFFVLPESLKPENRRAFSWGRANPIGALLALRRFPAVLGLAEAFFILTLGQMMLFSIWALYTSHRYGWDPQHVGLSLMLVGLLSAVVQAGLAKLRK